MSLARFLIRGFLDPLTESLSFAKAVGDQLEDNELKIIIHSFGYPLLKDYQNSRLAKLIENPTSLNLVRGASAPNMIW